MKKGIFTIIGLLFFLVYLKETALPKEPVRVEMERVWGFLPYEGKLEKKEIIAEEVETGTCDTTEETVAEVEVCKNRWGSRSVRRKKNCLQRSSGSKPPGSRWKDNRRWWKSCLTGCDRSGTPIRSMRCSGRSIRSSSVRFHTGIGQCRPKRNISRSNRC